MWGAKGDLNHAYFHLELSPKLKPYVSLQVGDSFFQFQAACFGLSTLPQIWQHLMNTFSSLWRQKGLLAFIYLDDILLLASSPENLRKALDNALLDLEEAGLV